jgi:hypothetical protein
LVAQGEVLHLPCYSLWNCCWSTPVHRASKIKKKEYFTKPYTAGNTRNLCKALPVTSVRIHRTAFIWVLSHALFNVHSSTQQKTPLHFCVTGFTKLRLYFTRYAQTLFRYPWWYRHRAGSFDYYQNSALAVM